MLAGNGGDDHQRQATVNGGPLDTLGVESLVGGPPRAEKVYNSSNYDTQWEIQALYTGVW